MKTPDIGFTLGHKLEKRESKKLLERVISIHSKMEEIDVPDYLRPQRTYRRAIALQRAKRLILALLLILGVLAVMHADYTLIHTL
ncbi:MAG: hypothetical protein U1D31_03405 [Patescibacteria group bacterium]|nr:hypothetical protein [Patescibacteria group bacterium]